MNETFDFLTNTIGDLVDFDVENMTPETGLLELNLDSLDYVSLQLAIRKKYRVEIKFDDFTSGQITTIGEFCEYIESRMVTA